MAQDPAVTPDHRSHYHSPINTVLRICALFGLLYLFILSITLMGESFKLFGADFARDVFRATANPIVGLMIGILVTALVQSSSTTTSLIVGLVAAGTTAELGMTDAGLSFEAAVPIVMGANIGTSVTNLIVSLGHVSRGEEFRRAFAGSVVHDLFNICSVVVLMPLQMSFNIIGGTAHWMESHLVGFGGLKFHSPLKTITKPVSEIIIEAAHDSAWLSMLIAFLLLFIALRYMVKTLKSLVLARVERFFQRFIFRTPWLGFILGIVLTMLVQSSSITTSIVVPLIGAGVITLVQVYPYLLGANIGTTITAFLASFVTGSHEAVAVAFAHLAFNTFGILIFWPLKFIPIRMAMILSRLTQKTRLIPVLYILIVFYTIPALVIFVFN